MGQVLDTGGSRPSRDSFETLRKIPFFALFPKDEHLELILDYGKWMEVGSGGAIMREGDEDPHLFVVVQGKLEVKVRGKPVAVIGAKETIGEIGAFLSRTRSATVRAVENSTVYQLNVAYLKKLPSHVLFDVMRFFFRVTADRLVKADLKLAGI